MKRPLILNSNAGTATHGGVTIEISRQRFEILSLLARKFNACVQPVSVECMLYGHRIDCDRPGDGPATVKVQVTRLRQLLRPLHIRITDARKWDHAAGYRLILDPFPDSEQEVSCSDQSSIGSGPQRRSYRRCFPAAAPSTNTSS